jgi:hypothetical protein
MNQPWWKESVVYPIYPHSFCNRDGGSFRMDVINRMIRS